MDIKYSEFTECSITFTPTRGEREVMLVALRAMRDVYESERNIEIFDYFIERIQNELSSTTQ